MYIKHVAIVMTHSNTRKSKQTLQDEAPQMPMLAQSGVLICYETLMLDKMLECPCGNWRPVFTGIVMDKYWERST